ncbi:GNAT family N-acetyltransferase [Phreatobacter aquaticus]|uniref:GNAT family N-acetyltransferase n=2 Tax=Phreatobacter aquaticus TaxID=2570229 RepID=A0A4D7QP18_9HYPH|nr:GNAT family N-acetyltransferase [Phreatobacter aquaticus]
MPSPLPLMTLPAPLVTARLVLSAITAADFEDLARLAADPEVGGKLKHGVLTPDQSRALLQDYCDGWNRLGYGVFMVRRRDDHRFVGLAGLWEHDDGHGAALRYAVMPEHRGQGFTKEAVVAVLDFAAARGLGTIRAVTRETNAVSRKILTGLGFHLVELRQKADRRVAIYSQHSPEPS